MIEPIPIGPPGRSVIIGADALVLIAGPCVLESAEMGLLVATAVRDLAAQAGLPFVFKASFDKANRSRRHSYRGPGLAQGLRWLAQIAEEVGVPVTTDIHLPSQAEPVAAVVDLIQIPAFLSRQTDLLLAAGATGKPVNVKRAQFLSAAECAGILEKLSSPTLLTERGTSFGYHDLVADLRNLPRMRAHGVPVVFDCTHAVQRPGALSTGSGGDRALAPVLARAAVAAGCDGIFMEVHPDPSTARSDAHTQLPLDEISPLLQQLAAIHKICGPGRLDAARRPHATF